jgi:ABC-type antimicrobial peptide transport system permease subunit
VCPFLDTPIRKANNHHPGARKLYEIVGVVEDGKYTALTEEPTPAVFWPILQGFSSDTVLLVRSPRNAEEMIPAVRQAITDVDSGIPIFGLSTWSDALSQVTFPARAATIALGVLGALVIMLAITGIFALSNYVVSRRMRELGIRMALGAQRTQMLHAALGRIGWLLAIGSFAGLLLGLAAGRVLSNIVYHATSVDPLVLVAAVLTMAAFGVLAAAGPARRALRAEPATLLRDE